MRGDPLDSELVRLTPNHRLSVVTSQHPPALSMIFISVNFFDARFWDRVHGGSTHLPIALTLTSALLDGAGSIAPPGRIRESLRLSGYFTLLLASLGTIPAVISGMMLTNWDAAGSGITLLHHCFVWPFFGLLIVLVVWRSIVRDRTSRIGFSIYFIAILTATGLVSIAGVWGGEMALGR
jgi:hypothetical protein